MQIYDRYAMFRASSALRPGLGDPVIVDTGSSNALGAVIGVGLLAATLYGYWYITKAVVHEHDRSGFR